MKRKPRYDISDFNTPRPTPHMAQIEHYTIGQWCPTPDGSGPPEAVVIEIKPKGVSFLIDGRMADSIALRLKSRHAINTFIEVLERYRDDVFPRKKTDE